jgi:tetratricopeptide (TPR) repeat protein
LRRRRRHKPERYSQAVEIDPHFGQAWNNLGTLLSEMGKTDEAITAFRRALSADPDDARAHYNLADTLTEAGRGEEAAVHWREYLNSDRDSEWATYARRQLS